MDGLMVQAREFLSTTLLGLLVGVVFHAYQLLIKKAGVGRFLVYLADFLFWLVLIVPVFLALLIINHGEMRIYVLISLGLGGLVYRFWVARVLDRPLSYGAGLVVNGCHWLLGRMVSPLAAAGQAFLTRFRPVPNGDEDDEDNKE